MILNKSLRDMLATCLYAAFAGRFDILSTVSKLSKHATKWRKIHDRRLHNLMRYINETFDMRLMGWMSVPFDQLQIQMHTDEDSGGRTNGDEVMSGIHLCVTAPRSSFPISGGCREQGIAHNAMYSQLVTALDALL